MISTYGETFSTEQDLLIVCDNNLQVNSTRNDSTGMFTRRHLFQIQQACMPTAASLANVTSIGFSSNTDNVSFCVEDFPMLPSQVASSGKFLSYPSFLVSSTYLTVVKPSNSVFN